MFVKAPILGGTSGVPYGSCEVYKRIRSEILLTVRGPPKLQPSRSRKSNSISGNDVVNIILMAKKSEEVIAAQAGAQ